MLMMMVIVWSWIDDDESYVDMLSGMGWGGCPSPGGMLLGYMLIQNFSL